VLSLLTTGRFVRSFRIEGEGNVERILIFSSGFVAVAAAAESPGNRTVLSVHGIDGKKTAQMGFEDEVSAWTKVEFECGLSCLAVAFRGRALKIMRIPDLILLVERITPVSVIALDFSGTLGALVVADMNGRIAVAGLSRSGKG
jgi:hypothetical protein